MPLADGSDLSVTPVDRALPLEMLDLIGRQCDVQTLSRLSQTSQAMLSWFGPILLRHIVILPKKTDKLPTWLVPRIYALFGHRERPLATPIEVGLSLRNILTLETSASLMGQVEIYETVVSTARLLPCSLLQRPTLDLTERTIYLDLDLQVFIPGVPATIDSYADSEGEPVESSEEDRTNWVVFEPSNAVLDLLNPECVRFAHKDRFRTQGGEDGSHKRPVPRMHRLHPDAAHTIRTRWTRLKTVIMDHVDLVTGEADDLANYEDPADEEPLFFMVPDLERGPVDPHGGERIWIREVNERQWTLRLDVSNYDNDHEGLAARELSERLSEGDSDDNLLDSTQVLIVFMVSSERRKQQLETWLNDESWDLHRDRVTVEVQPALV